MKILKIDTNQIISVFLGIILLSSVAAVLPVSAYDTDSWCNWRGSFFRDGYEKLTSGVSPVLKVSDDYTHVMPAINAWGDQFGVPPLPGGSDVTFFYYEEDSNEKKFIRNELVDPEYGAGETIPFDYGIEVMNFALKDRPYVTLICEHERGTVTSTQTVDATDLQYNSKLKSDGNSISSSPSAPSPSTPSAPSSSASIPDPPEQEIISTTNIKLNAKEFTLPKNRYDQTQVVIKGIIDDYVRGVSVYVTVENPNGEAQEQKVMAADGHYMVTYLIHQDFTLGKYSVSTKYSGQVIDETTFVVSETVAQVGPGTPKDRQIPSWIKNNAKWWAEGKIGETDFLNGIEYMVKEKIIDIPDLPRKASTTAKEGVPSWIKNTASWWGNDLITEDDFASGIKWLVENGIIRIN